MPEININDLQGKAEKVEKSHEAAKIMREFEQIIKKQEQNYYIADTPTRQCF